MLSYYKVVCKNTLRKESYCEESDDQRMMRSATEILCTGTDIKLYKVELDETPYIKEYLELKKAQEKEIESRGFIVHASAEESFCLLLKNMKKEETLLDQYHTDQMFEEGSFEVFVHHGIRGAYTEERTMSFVKYERDSRCKEKVFFEESYNVASEDARVVVETYLDDKGVVLDGRYSLI